MTYYFDTLALHPKPEQLESLTSYLIRLAEANGIRTVDGLTAVCFPNQNRRITRDLADYPPISMDELVRVGGCAQQALLKTTFVHVGAKFGRSIQPQPLSRFLSGSVAQHLRYCPMCLAEKELPYYSLVWRFFMIVGCPAHCSKLLDRCGRCERRIPFLAAPLKIGVCPSCGWNLGTCLAEPAPDEVLEVVRDRLLVLEFLLAPHDCEVDSSENARRIGRQFARMRRVKQVTAVEIARRIGTTLTVVEGIERGDLGGRGATFQSYLKYADYLGVPLRETFESALQRWQDEQGSSTIAIARNPACPLCQQIRSVSKYGHNRNGSQRYLCRYCHHSFTPLRALP